MRPRERSERTKAREAADDIHPEQVGTEALSSGVGEVALRPRLTHIQLDESCQHDRQPVSAAARRRIARGTQLASPLNGLRALLTPRAVRQDLIEPWHERSPGSVACINVADPQLIPIQEILSAGGRVHLFDWQPARVARVVAETRLRQDGATRKDTAGSISASELRVTVADLYFGRGARFATRVEEIIACASGPGHAIELAEQECNRCCEQETSAPSAHERFEIVISILAPPDETYACFAEAWRRRFALDLVRWSRDLTKLRARLFQTQLDGHALELKRLVAPAASRIYFVTAPCETWWDSGWFASVGAPLAFQTLSEHFVTEPCTPHLSMSEMTRPPPDRRR